VHDLQSHITSYAGHNRITRLIFIATKRAGQPLELEALKLAHDEVKKVRHALAAPAGAPELLPGTHQCLSHA
jgi:hypothetical protein